jgi:hypothetical protein
VGDVPQRAYVRASAQAQTRSSAQAQTRSSSQAQTRSSSQTVEFQLSLTTDDAPTETGWKLTRNDTSPCTLIMQKNAGWYTAKNQIYVEKLLIEKGYYIFTITDSYGDGLTYGASGKYSVQVGGYPFYTGRDFEYEEKLPFFVSMN